MRVFGVDLWCYRNKCAPWFGHSRYSLGKLHYVTIGPLVIVVDYRAW